MADQDWLTAGVYLVGLLGIALLMSALSTRSTRIRASASTGPADAGN
ncbi:hypothetical protein [Paraburkholderia panacisoli]|nr:hypothetical protein [Paraburkholderia panacisoli]